MIYVDYPYHFDGRRRTATTDVDGNVRDLIEQVLFTAPGERVNRPTFGCGVMQLVFAPNSDQLAATTQFLIQSALQQWLGDLITVDGVEVTNDDATLTITISYTIRRTQTSQVAEFSVASASAVGGGAA
jgi:phage baseplate assembly protein W